MFAAEVAATHRQCRGSRAGSARGCAAPGPVVITANEQVWIQVKDGAATLKEGVLEAGQSLRCRRPPARRC